jgi:hypothetical protein
MGLAVLVKQQFTGVISYSLKHLIVKFLEY